MAESPRIDPLAYQRAFQTNCPQARLSADEVTELRRLFGAAIEAALTAGRAEVLRSVMKQLDLDLRSRAIHHIDGNPLNNDPANLRVVDIKANRKET